VFSGEVIAGFSGGTIFIRYADQRPDAVWMKRMREILLAIC
jgi:hypothetical protein